MMTTFAKSLPFFALILAFISFFTTSTHAATFNIQNRCGYTVWPAASFGGGRRLDPGQTWPLFVAAGTSAATIWGRTGCNFDGNGQGRCQTGDCRGGLQCQAPSSGQPPLTLAEFTLNGGGNNDYYDISVIDGFNIPMQFSPRTGGCFTVTCTYSQCPDAYLFPSDNTKTRACRAGGDFNIVFCP